MSDGNGSTNPSDNLVLEDEIRIARDRVIALKADRTAINEQITEIKATMVTLGISKRAFNQALQYFEDTSEERDKFDQAYVVARRAMEVPVQADMFGGLPDEEEVDSHEDEMTT